TAPPSIGVEWFPTPNAGEQCGDGPTSQWATSPNWTTPILIDTDSRAGGCQLAFGIYDPGGALTGMTASYTWAVSSGGDAGQCQNAANGDNQGTFNLPIEPFQTFGSTVLDDTDNRSGYCNLTFTVSGLSGVGLDIQYYPQDDLADASQCRGYLPEGSYYTAYAGAPVTIGLDTDDRGGGCDLSLRIEHFGFGPVQHITKATSAK
ncbi:MAG TPA: hypothetical protein VHU61_05280, partial [Solirubrobacteraceae bacterium]|nr:hypothetical protein [Solirubrobacteraceae bacterium]